MSEEVEDKSSKTQELLIGIILAIFAAVLAINDLGAGRFGDDEKYANAMHTEMYSWYQSKSIKQSLYKGQVELLEALEQSKAIKSDYKNAIDSHVVKLQNKIDRYGKEMKEIQEGSAGVGKENWIQDKDGEMGKIIGAKEWEETAAVLGRAGDWYDIASLFLQVCIVFGAISLVIQSPFTRKIFMFLMIGMGIAGAYFSLQAYLVAFSV